MKMARGNRVVALKAEFAKGEKRYLAILKKKEKKQGAQTGPRKKAATIR
jgi:hypothetical protein